MLQNLCVLTEKMQINGRLFEGHPIQIIQYLILVSSAYLHGIALLEFLVICSFFIKHTKNGGASTFVYRNFGIVTTSRGQECGVGTNSC